MKLLLPLLPLLPLFTLALAVEDMLGECADVNPDVLNAIGHFCSQAPNDHITVPSDYAKEGAHGGPTGQTHVFIEGECDPPMWVPGSYCMTQFEYLCKNGYNQNGAGQGYWGKNNCQVWTIVP